MSLSTLRSSPTPRTPRQRVYGRAEQYFDITAPGARSSGTQFLPSPITEEPTDNWSAEDEAVWDQRLAKGGSRKILTARKRMDIRWWLQNPNAPLPGGTKAEKRYQANIKHESYLYELQDNQVYRKEYHDTRRDEILPARYALCYNDAFEILTTVHEKLMHAGKYFLKATNFYTNYIIASDTAFEHTRRLWHGPSRDDHAWISAHCAHCNKEKAQKNNTGVIPIQSHYPGQRMVLDLMDFRVSVP
jgi:hypothetical protein